MQIMPRFFFLGGEGDITKIRLFQFLRLVILFSFRPVASRRVASRRVASRRRYFFKKVSHFIAFGP
jgi:hypothetical protein